MSLDALLAAADDDARAGLLLAELNDLTRHHRDHCPPYRRILDAVWDGRAEAESLDRVPYLPVGLFKELDLVSTASPTLTLRSSGTSGQRPSRIHVDAETSERQSRALIETFRPILGSGRLPLLVIDSAASIRDPAMISARGAGILGMMKFGARPCFALDDALRLQPDEVRRFLDRSGDRPFLIFGFTYLIWSALLAAAEDEAFELSSAILIHSGGWKTLEAERVDNAAFRARLTARFGVTRIHNFYGFVEQLGSIFVEGPGGYLMPPPFARAIIRDPLTLAPVAAGRPGLIQLLSAVPRSYPGHSLLTEDLGKLDPLSGGLTVLGRVPAAELRGCSDVIAASKAA